MPKTYRVGIIGHTGTSAGLVNRITQTATGTTESAPAPVEEAGGGGGSKKRRKRRKPRTVYIGKRRHTIWTPEQERRLVEQFRRELEDERKVAAMAADAGRERQMRRLVTRQDRRLADIEERRAAWLEQLRRDDDEILLVLG